MHMTWRNYDLVEVLEKVWVQGVARDYETGFLWNGETSVHASLAFHIRNSLLSSDRNLRIWHEAYYRKIYESGTGGIIDLVLVEVNHDAFTRKIHYNYSQIKMEEDVRHLSAIEVKYARTGGIDDDLEKLQGMQKRFDLLPVFVFIDSDGSPDNPSATLNDTIPTFVENDILVLYGYPYDIPEWKILYKEQ